MTITSTLTEPEETPWIPNDPMPAWVCAIGGYEMLSDGRPDLAREWMIRYGMKAHAPIRGGGFLSRQLHSLRGAAHFGFLWWGHPNGWGYRWPLEWQLKLADEAAARCDAPLRIFTSQGVSPYAPKRRHR